VTKLSYEEWEPEYIRTKCNITEEEIENMKDQYYCGLNTYKEFKLILKEEYEEYLKND
jgi:hypothetical protein